MPRYHQVLECASTWIRQSGLKTFREMMDGVDSVDDMETDKSHVRTHVHFVRNVHSVHYLGKCNWFRLLNLR